tara:strand:+ start:759 stop:968 length:210 start_codon:yes stop_codon:yes gene_type:complete
MGSKQYGQTKHGIKNNTARIELPAKLLEQLILSGLISGNQCICLNESARKSMWKSILEGSLARREAICL